jgi:hypothetical protein
MIKGIASGQGVIVHGNNGSYPYVNMSNASAGMVRYNGNNQNFEVYDGSSWMTISSNYITLELDADVKSLLEWARKKRTEEIERDLLAHTNPTIKDLIKQIEEKEEQILVVQNLLREESKIGTN